MPDAIDRPTPYANPRPGVLRALGICNIIFAVLGSICVLWSMYFTVVASASAAAAKVEVKVNATTGQAKPAGVPMVSVLNPFAGFQDRNFVLWSYVDNGVGMLINGLMFVFGIGMINLKRWGARGWGNLAWVRIVSAFLIWGCYIVAVAPGFSESMARGATAQLASQGMPANRMPPMGYLTQIYSIMNLIAALLAMVFTSIYPAISLWLLSRPGVKAAIVDSPVTLERELP